MTNILYISKLQKNKRGQSWKGMQNINNKVFDMATTAKTMPQFSADAKEDINTWVRDVLLIGEVAGMSSEDVCRAMIISLKGEALSWALQILEGRVNDIKLEVLITLLKERFGSKQSGDIALKNFLIG